MNVIRDMERAGVIELAMDEVPETCPLVVKGTDGRLDLYFPYESGGSTPIGDTYKPLPPLNSLLDFARRFQVEHPKAIMAKGSIQTHYCAWPMPAIRALSFATWEGCVYRWNFMPFDRPWSPRLWHYLLHKSMNERYPFVMFYLTTFVICAEDETKIDQSIAAIRDKAKEQKWMVDIPPPRYWTSDYQSLHLDVEFEGIRPA